MRTEEELVKIINDAQDELKELKKHNAVRNIDAQLHAAHAAGVEEEDILAVVDILYHPENYHDNNEPIAEPTYHSQALFPKLPLIQETER
jgi:hypothetical protein